MGRNPPPLHDARLASVAQCCGDLREDTYVETERCANVGHIVGVGTCRHWDRGLNRHDACRLISRRGYPLASDHMVLVIPDVRVETVLIRKTEGCEAFGPDASHGKRFRNGMSVDAGLRPTKRGYRVL